MVLKQNMGVECMRVCMGVHACRRPRRPRQGVCVCACVCVCMRVPGRDRDARGEGVREGASELAQQRALAAMAGAAARGVGAWSLWRAHGDDDDDDDSPAKRKRHDMNESTTPNE